MKTQVIRIDGHTHKRLRALARSRGKSMRQVIAELADRPAFDPGDFLRRIEDLLIIQDAERQLHASGLRLTDQADVERRLQGRLKAAHGKRV